MISASIVGVRKKERDRVVTHSLLEPPRGSAVDYVCTNERMNPVFLRRYLSFIKGMKSAGLTAHGCNVSFSSPSR